MVLRGKLEIKSRLGICTVEALLSPRKRICGGNGIPLGTLHACWSVRQAKPSRHIRPGEVWSEAEPFMDRDRLNREPN